MPQNEGALDRVIRVIIGVALIVTMFTVFTSGVPQIIAGVLAAVMLVTAALGFCPLYALFHINTKSQRRAA